MGLDQETRMYSVDFEAKTARKGDLSVLIGILLFLIGVFVGGGLIALVWMIFG